MLYTMLSRAKSRDRLKVLNFFENQIKVNNDAVVERERMKEKCVLDCSHPLVQMGNMFIQHNVLEFAFKTFLGR